MKIINLPTGKLFIDNYDKGELETLSIGDYGKKQNIKAQFLGYNSDINGVHCKEIMPMSEKWVVTLSTQYGCTQKCTFCDVPNVKFKGNASISDLDEQLTNALKLYPDVKYTERLNIHYARMGEPMINFKNVISHAEYMGSIEFKRKLIRNQDLRVEVIHPVFTTMLPNSISLEKTFDNLYYWCANIKNSLYKGQANLQLSINSTNDEQRDNMFQGKAHELKDIADICSNLPLPVGRKYCLNFALADGYEVDAKKLKSLFDPEDFMVKITPIHNNNACTENGIQTSSGYESFVSYKQAEEDLIKEGFDVLIFVPSEDEENSTITCGNAILGGSKMRI